MKITMRADEGINEVSITLSDESDIDEVVEKLKVLLVAYGYHPDNVKEIFGEEI